MSTSDLTFPAPRIVLTVKLSAPDMDQLVTLIEQVAGTVDDRDRIAAVRVNEVACCAELDLADRPLVPQRLH